MFQKFPFHTLHAWYQDYGRHELPWRDYNFNKKQLGYRVWLAETMLQQTQVERVKTYFENILEAFPTVEDLAGTSYEDFFPYYKGLGYYSRERNMLHTAQQVSSEYSGIFPTETQYLKKLPGVGPYTAEAIRAFAYDIPTLSFDTNLEKIFSRYYHGNKFQKLSQEEKQLILQDFLASGISARDINNALMDYGATISLNNISGIDWEKYHFSDSKFYKTRGSLEPVKQKKQSSFPKKQAYIICVLHENHKRYFSSSSDFTPFFIGKNSGNPRIIIQEYFLRIHKLEVSVRPPEIFSYNKHDIPYMICYAQVQSGVNHFQIFENLQVRGYEEGFVDELDFGETLNLFSPS